MSKVTCEAVNSANLKMNNSVDTERAYEISSNLTVNGTTIQNFDSGVVKNTEQVTVATFNKWGENNLSLNFQVSDVTAMCAIIGAVDGFIADCADLILNGEIVFN